MFEKEYYKKWYIKVYRYLFNKKFLSVMAGPLKGYLWTTASSYDHILGSYEDPETVKTFCSWLKPDTVFYDLGGNVGFYALMANRFISAGKIYSFEPIPFVRFILEKHIELNKKYIQHNNISILPFAISDHEKEITFSNDISQRDGNTYIKSAENFTKAKDSVIVKCYSIDELLQQGYAAPDIIKIDVEGAELDVLNGAINTLKQYKPHILLATHDCHLPGVKDQCINFLVELGYTLKHTGYYHRPPYGLDDYIAVHQTKL
jgi:FkbM family methyltransferase